MFKLYPAVLNVGQVFSLCVAPNSPSCMNEYMAIDGGWYLYEQRSRINCSVAERFPEKLSWCLIEKVCQGKKCNTL